MIRHSFIELSIKIYTFESILLMLSNINITPVKTKVEIIVLVQFVKWSNILSKLWLILIKLFMSKEISDPANHVEAAIT